MSNLDLSIIILSFNTKNITDECLRRLKLGVCSCEKILKNEIEVIVVDNASSDGSVEMIKKNHPWVILIESRINTGFSKGNNLGFKKTTKPFILFLNSDVYIEVDTLTESLKYFQKNPNCSVLGPRLVFGDGSFQPSAGNLPTPLNITAWILGLSLIPGLNRISPFHPNYEEFFGRDREVGWVTGAFFMMKKEVIEEIGGFDENIFMYLEEIEFCKRIKNAKFQIWYAPEIKATHLAGASSKFDPTLAFINELKGLRYYLRKYYSDFYGIVKIFLILGLIFRIVAFALLGKTKRARAYMKGLSVI